MGTLPPAPRQTGPLPRAKGNSVLHKNFIGMKSTPHLITRDHDPRRADQCNLHTHVIANKNKSPR